MFFLRYKTKLSMKMNRQYIITFILLIFAALPMQAQEFHPASDAELMASRYVQAYDSLLDNYYLRRHAHHNLRSHREFSLDEFVFSNTEDEAFKKAFTDHVQYYWRYPKSDSGKLEFWVPIRWMAEY